ncbi:hypothetical protein AAMO2058_000619900 [Amorphochlora amoebiformis]
MGAERRVLDRRFGRDGVIGMCISGLGPAIAVVFTNPMDTAKTRLQMQGELRKGKGDYAGLIDVLRKTYQTEGITGLQRGVKIGMVRDFSKCFFRIGLYDPLLFRLHPNLASKPPIAKKITAGATSGLVSALVCNPLDVLKTRVQASGGVSGSHYTYKAQAGISVLRTIVSKEGIKGLWIGLTVNASRSVLFTSVVLPTNSQLKESAEDMKIGGILRDVVCSVGASILGVCCINPLDVVRTRLYNQPVDSNGVGTLYKGPMDAFRSIAVNEGILSFWKGVFAHYARAGPHTVLSLTFIGILQRGIRQLRAWQLGVDDI